MRSKKFEDINNFNIEEVLKIVEDKLYDEDAEARPKWYEIEDENGVKFVTWESQEEVDERDLYYILDLLFDKLNEYDNIPNIKMKILLYSRGYSRYYYETNDFNLSDRNSVKYFQFSIDEFFNDSENQTYFENEITFPFCMDLEHEEGEEIDLADYCEPEKLEEIEEYACEALSGLIMWIDNEAGFELKITRKIIDKATEVIYDNISNLANRLYMKNRRNGGYEEHPIYFIEDLACNLYNLLIEYFCD